MSTFHGLEMAKQALFTQQSALYTTGHNIANANTEGYTRQRVNFEADTAMPAAAKNRMGIPGQIGTGVKAGSIQRIRDEFLDLQFRNENSLSGYWETRADALGRMENVMNDLNETGLSAVMNQFWSSLQDLAVNPTNMGARSVVVQRGIALADTFNYLNQSLTQINADLNKEINDTVGDVNILLEQIHGLNDQIKKLEVNGYVTNDLYDKRDMLIDELSGILPIEVTRHRSAEHANEVAEGLVSITLRTNSNVDINLVDIGEDAGPLKISTIDTDDETVKLEWKKGEGLFFTLGTENVTKGVLEVNQGSLQSLMEASTEDFLEMQQDLKKMVKAFAEEFNKVHANGHPNLSESELESIDSIKDEIGNTVIHFFDEDALNKSDWEMKVLDHIKNNPSLITASPSSDELGDGSNAFALANLLDEPISELDGKSIREFYAEKIGSLAVSVEEAERMQTNTSVLLSQLEGNRQSVSSVSLDEEMTNLIKFQHAYNAAARTMTATDELLDRVINNMGLVGR